MRKIMSLFLLILVISYGMGFPQESPEVEARFVEIIIKVKPGIITMPEGTYKAPIEEIEIKEEGLKSINKKFNLISIEKMFARKKPKEEVAKDYPEREARAPEDVEEPDLENIFLLRFPEHIDPNTIISEYEKIEDVIYAEENMPVSIY